MKHKLYSYILVFFNFIKLFHLVILTSFISYFFDVYNFGLIINLGFLFLSPFLIFLSLSILHNWLKTFSTSIKIDIIFSISLIFIFNFTYFSVNLRDSHFIQFLISKGINHRISEILFLTFIYLVFLHIIFSKNIVNGHIKFVKIFYLFFLLSIFLTKLNHKDNRIIIENKTSIRKVKQSTVKPDIYFIILDAYASNQTLKNKFSFDNSYFINHLSNKGFFVPKNPHSSYNYTPTSLGSILNMSYLNLNQNSTLSSFDISKLDYFVKNNQVTRLLNNEGYRNNFYSILKIGNESEVQFGINTTSTSGYFIKNSFYKLLNIINDNNEKYYSDCYMYNINSLKFLKQKIESNYLDSVPSFNLIHILASHSPFVIDSVGNFDQTQSIQPLKVQQKYLNSVKFINKNLIKLIDNLLNKSNEKPIIIIQSDHGSHLVDLKETTQIFSAIYFPNKDYLDVDENYNSVNTFRYIFNKYFHYNYDYLPNKSILVHYPY